MTDTPSWADDPVIAPPTATSWADVPVPTDKYRVAAEEEYNRLSNSSPIGRNPTQTGYAARAAKPFGMGWRDDIAAGAMVPFEMIKRGTLDPQEAYRYTRARETLNEEKLAENTKGVLGGVAEGLGIAGSVGNFAGSGVRAGAQAIPFTKAATIPASVVNTGANMLRGGAYGAIQGAGDAPSADQMGRQALAGGVLGSALGGILPIGINSALAAGKASSQLPRLRDPGLVATEEVAAAARAAGVSPETIIQRLQTAQASGQPYTVADAIGHEGQRKLTAMAKVPGEQRQSIIDFLATRDANMPERVGSQVGREMGAPASAEQSSRALIAKAKAEARPFYDKAENVGPIWNEQIDSFLKEPTMLPIIRHGVTMQRQESLLGGKPFKPSDYGITGFNEAGDPIMTAVPNMKTLHAAKVGLDSMIEAQTDKITGAVTNQGRILQGVQKRLLENIDSMNPDYARARQLYAGPRQVETAVRTGQTWPTTGRGIDNIDEFNRFNQTAQQGARIGYADKVRQQLEGGDFPRILKEKSLKGQTEIGALAGYGPTRTPGNFSPLKDFLKREEDMRRTTNKAAGGSSSIENAADIASAPSAGAVFGGLAKDAFTGNLLGAGKTAADILKIYGKGQSEAQRVAITKALMETDPKMAQAMADRIKDYELRRRGVNPWTGTARYREGQ